MKDVTDAVHFLLEQMMDDIKRENVISMHFQKRNYCTLQTFLTTKKQQLTHSLVETDVGRSNSTFYRCDSVVIDQNFTRFLLWLRDQTKFRNRFHDIECIVAPLFCYLYMEILSYEHTDKAASFFKCHFSSINENKCDNSLKDLIFRNGDIKPKDKDIFKLKEKFKSNRTVLKLDPESLRSFKKFVLENCHIMFVRVLQNNFDFQVDDLMTRERGRSMKSLEYLTEAKFQKFSNAARELLTEPIPMYTLRVSSYRNDIRCGLLRRQHGLVVLAENNNVHLIPLHPLDTILKVQSRRLKLMHHSDYICCLDISRDNQILVSGSADRTLCIYNLEKMILVKKCIGHVGLIYCVKISDNGNYVATGCADGTARLWQIKDGRILRIFIGHTQIVTCVVFHPNCLYVATGSADGNIRLWCLNKASCLRLLRVNNDTIYDLAYCPNGKLLASVGEDKSIRIWDLLSSKVVIELRCKITPFLKIIWNSDGSELCAGTLDGVIRVWNVKNVHRTDANNKYIHAVVTNSLKAKLLDIEYTFGIYSILTI